MIPLNHYAASISAAIRLARLDAKGIDDFDITPTGFWRSFHAAGIVLPFYVITASARWSVVPETVSFARFAAVEAIAYVIAWTVFPVLMAFFVKFLDREENYIRGIVAFNWAAVLQNIVYTPVALAGISGAALGPFAMVAILAVLVYGWFVLRHGFAVSAGTAWMLVGMDFSLGLMLTQWVHTLIGG